MNCARLQVLKMVIRNLMVFVCAVSVSRLLFAQNDLFRHLEESQRLIRSGNCSGAEAYTRVNVPPPVMYTVLGDVQLDCRNNRVAAIEYFKIAARENETVATETLIKMGVTPPERRRVNAERATLFTLPPPLAQPQQPQQIIIQQPQQMPSLGGCTQDGGILFCPNHPNTKSVPFNPFGPLRY